MTPLLSFFRVLAASLSFYRNLGRAESWTTTNASIKLAIVDGSGTAHWIRRTLLISTLSPMH
jgi:hypothetical protein